MQWRYVIQQSIASVGILIAYGALGLHSNGQWVDALYGLLYSFSSFILFGILDSFHHTFVYGVKLMAEDLRTKIKDFADLGLARIQHKEDLMKNDEVGVENADGIE